MAAVEEMVAEEVVVADTAEEDVVAGGDEEAEAAEAPQPLMLPILAGVILQPNGAHLMPVKWL